MKSGETFLAGRKALVTGGAVRIGRATALALAGAGCDVVIHYRKSGAEAEATAAEIVRAGRRAWTLQADLSDASAAEGLMGRAVTAAGPIDILINSAAIFPGGRLTEFRAAELAESVAVNATAPLLLSRNFAAQGVEGDIVNFLDCRIGDYDREHVPYHLSKRMLFALTRMMALEFAPRLRVNGVAPGLILAPPGGDPSYPDKLAPVNPLHRHGDPDDVTRAVLFLLASPLVTGQVIFVDGGRHLRGSVYG